MVNNVKLISIADFIEQKQNKDNPYLNGSYQEDYAKAADPDKNDKILWAAAEGVKRYSVLNELRAIQEELRQEGLDGYLQQTSENEFKLIVVKRGTNMANVVGQDGRLNADNEGELYKTALTMKTAHDIKGGMGGVNLGLGSLNNRVPTIAGGKGKLSFNGESHFTVVNTQEGLLKGFLESLPNLVNYYHSKGKNPLLGVSAAGGIAADNVYMTSIAGVKKQDNPATSGKSGENAIVDATRRERFNLKLLASELFPIIQDINDDAAMSDLITALSELGLANEKIENREHKEGDKEFVNLYGNIINNYPSLFGKDPRYIDALRPIFRDIYNMGWRNNMSGTSEEAFGKAIGDMGSRALVPGGNAMTYSLRNQNIGIQHLVTQKMRNIMVPGVFTTKRATASGLKYAVPIPKKGDEDQIAPYDAGVPVIFLTDAKLAEVAQGPYKNATARAGQTIVTNEMADMLDTSFIKHDETISAKEIDDFIEDRQKDLDKWEKWLKEYTPNTKKWEKLNKKINDLREIVGNRQQKIAANRQEVARILYDDKIRFKKWRRVPYPNFTETENGGYIVSADRVVTGFNSGERGVGGNGERSAVVIGPNRLFSDTKIKDKNGNEFSLREKGIQAIMSPEQQDARKTMQFAMTQLDYAFRDMVKLRKMKEFWDRINQDYENPKTEEVKKAAKGLKFLLRIAKPNADFSSFDLEDSAEAYRELYQEFDDKTVNYLIDYIDTLRDEFGGNMGLGKGFKLDDDGNLLYSGNPIVGYTSMKKDINDRYEGMDYGGSSLSTGATSLGNFLRTVSIRIPEWDRNKVNNVVNSIVSQIEPPEENVKEIKKRQADFAAAMRQMEVGKKQDINSFTPENGYITVGRGSGYTINLDEIEPEEREGAVVTNEEKTLTYRANKAIQDLAKKYNIDQSQFKLVIDPGDDVNVIDSQTFDGVTKYGYGSNLLFLPANVTNWEGAQGDVNRKLVNALKNEDLGKRAQALPEIVRLLWRDVYHKDGSDFKRLMKVDAPYSFTMHSVGINPHGILKTKEKYKKADKSDQKISDISSFGYRVSVKTLKKIYEIALGKTKKGKKSKGKKEGPLTVKDLRAAVRKLGIFKPSEVDMAGTDQLINWIVQAQTVGSQHFKAALEKGTLEGFRAFLGRYPFFSMFSDLFPAELWADQTVGDSSMMLPYIFADMQRADFDGDHQVSFTPVLSKDGKKLFDVGKETFEKAGRIQLYSKLANEELEKVKGNTPVFKNNASAAVPKIDFDYAAAIATRVQKPFVGLFSNMNQEFKEMVTKAGLGDLSALGNKDASDEEKEMAVRAMLVKAMFDAMEQDTISAKKLVNRLMAAKINKAGVKAPTNEQLFAFYNDAVKDLTSIIDDMRSGKAKPAEIISRLANMGVFDVDDKGAFLNSRETKNYLSIIESLPGGTEILKKVIPGYKPFDEATSLEEQASWGGVHGDDIVNAMDPLAKYLQSKGKYTGPATAAGLLQAVTRHEYTPEKRSPSVYNMVNKSPANTTQEKFYDLLKKENEMLDSAGEEGGGAGGGAGGGSGGSPSSSGGGSDDGGKANLDTIIKTLNSLEVKNFSATPTTWITSNLYPFDNLKNNTTPDNQTIETVFGSYDEKKNKYGKNLGFASREEMLANIKNGAEPSALAGHVTGSGLQFYRTMSRVLRNREGAPKITSVKEMMKYVRDNRAELTEEAKNNKHIDEALFYLTEFDKNVDLYEKYMKGVHGASGLNDAKAYLASKGESSFISGLEDQIEAGAQSYDKFIESFGGEEVVTPINEVGFIGALDNEGSKRYKGRNDTLNLVLGDDNKYHLISIDDKHRTSKGGTITDAELAQQVMNLAAMKAEMAYAKSFLEGHEKDEGKGYKKWRSTARAKNLIRDLVGQGGKYADYSPEQLYEMLTMANDAQQYVEVLTPEGAEYFQIGPNGGQIGDILEEIKLRKEGKTDGTRLSELLHSVAIPVSTPGTKVSVQKNGNNPFLGMSQQKQANYYAENLKKLHDAKLEIAKAQYQAGVLQYENGLSEDEKRNEEQKWQDQVNEQSEKVKNLTKIIKKAERILPKKVREEALGGNEKEDLYPELKEEGEEGYVDIKSSQEYLDWEKEQKAAKAKRYDELKKTIYDNQAGIDRRKRERGKLGDKISEEQSYLFAEQDTAANLAIEEAKREMGATDWKAIVGEKEIRAIDVRYAALGAASNQKEAIAAAELLNKQLQTRADLLERIKEIEYELETLDEGDPAREKLETEKAVTEKQAKELEANVNYLKEQAKVTKKGGEKVSIGPGEDDEKLINLQEDEKYNDYVAQKKKDALDDYNKTRKRINEIDETITKGDIAASNADVTAEDAKAWEKTKESLVAERTELSKKSDSSSWDKKIDANDLAMARINATDADAKAAKKRQKEVNNAYKAIIEERQILAENLKKATYLLEHPDDDASEDVQKARQKVVDDIKEKIEKNKATAQNLEEKFGINANDFEAKSAPEQVRQELKEKADKLEKSTEETIKEEQQKQLAKYEALQKKRIALAEQMQRRRIANKANGTSQSQIEANLLLNELDQEEMDEINAKLTSVNWTKNVGGAEAMAKANKKIAASAAQAEANVAAFKKEANPTIWTQMANSVKGWFSQLIRGQLVWKILGQVQRALGAIIEDAKKLDAVLVNLQIVTGDTRENTRSLISTYASLAQTMSSTTSEVASAANDWLRQGYSISESIDLITASLQLSKLGMIDSGRATSYLTSMLKGFKLEASDATTIVDKLTKVDMSAATSAGDIAEALRQFATTAQLSGIDLDESIAMATTIMDVSQKDASSTGNAIKTMLSRYGNVKAGIYSGMNITGDQNETTESLNDIDKVLKKLGISLRSSNLEFRDFDDVLDDIAAKWETLDSVSKNAIATAMAGTRQRESFLVLMENYDKYKGFIEEAANSEGTAAEKYKAYEDSLEASQKKLSAALEELSSKTEVVDFFKTINKLGAEIVKWLPTIFRYITAFTSGKAFNQILRLLSASGSFNLSFNGLKKGAASLISGGYISQRLGFEEVGKSAVGRTGLIDSAIRNGTKPIYQELQEIANNTARINGTQPIGQTGGTKTGLASSSSGASSADANGQMSLDDILKNPSLSLRQKRKAVKDFYNSKLDEDKKQLNNIKTSKDGEGKERYKEEKKRLREERERLRKERKKTLANVERQSFVASHTVEPQLADGTKLSDMKPHTGKKKFGKHKGEKYTYYTAKGHKDRISEKDYKALVQQKADNEKQAEEEYKKAKKNATVSKVTGSVASGAMSFITADTTNSHYNQFTGKLEENETNDIGAKIAMKSTSALLTGLGTYFLGPLGGMLGQLGADLFNKHVMGLFFPALQKENINRDRRNKAEDTKKKVEESSSYVSAVTELASKADLTSDDYKKLLVAQQEMRDFLLKPENSGIKEDFERYVRKILQNQEEGNGLAGKTFAQLTQLTDMTASDRQKAAYAMELAQLKQENAASLNDYEATLYDYYDLVDKGMSKISEKIFYGGKGREIATAMGEDYDAIYDENYKKFGHDRAIERTNSTIYRTLEEEFGNEGINGRIAYLEEMIKNGSLSTDVKSQFEIVIKHLQNIADTQEAIHKTVEKQRVSEGIYEMSVGKNADGSAKTLLDMSQTELQNMGLDEIVYRVAEYLEKTYGGMLDGTSYFYTDENGKSQVKSTARKDIISGLKTSNENIYNVITGKNYTLSDVFGMKDGETKTQMLNNFANALSVTVDQLPSVANVFGDFTLGDVSSSAEDLLAKLQSMETAIGNIASGTQTWATTLQTIIKNYPELIGYATDEYTISLAMFQKMDSFKQLMTNAQFEDIISNETYFKEFSQRLTNNLTEKEKNEFDGLKLTTVKDVMTYVSNNDTDLSKKVGGLLRKEMENIKLSSEMQMQLAEKLVAIKSAQLDKEIDNLTSQKEALQDINSQREYENKLIEAKLKLEEATKEKKRVWREGAGWVYEEDQAAISEAKDNLESVSNEKAISALTQQINQLNADKENLNSILSDQEEAVQEGFLKAFGEFDGITNGSLESFGASIQSFIKTSDESAADRFDQWMNVYNSDRAQGITDLKTAWDNLTKAKKEKDRTDLTEEQKKTATENYNAALGEFQKQYSAGVESGYWSEKDLEKGGSLYGKFGEDNEASKAALGEAGWGQAAYDESLYVKDEDGKWKKFKYNSNENTTDISDKDWNRFFDKNNGGANFYNQSINGNGHRVWAKNDSENAVGRFIYENAQKDPTIQGFTRWMSQNFKGYSMVKLKNGSWYRLMGDSIRKIDNPEIVSENEVPEDVRAAGGKFRKGTLDVSKGNRIPLLMNEEGSEAVVTPNGTITALPTHSGIVPADITSNLWNLGNYAPDLLSALQRQAMLGMNVPGMANNDNSVDNSVSINTVQMTVDADNSFNVDSFVQQLQQVAALTRNNRH